MGSDIDLRRSQTLDANKHVHSQLAMSGEYNQSPHFLAENQEKVLSVLKDLVSQLPPSNNTRLLDFGCGTGFIIHLAVDLVDQIDGVDITPEMMKQVQVNSGNITLTECLAEETPFPNEIFDLATAYSFMDHLLDYKALLNEAYRVLKPDGIFYSDLNPNRAFINHLDQLHESDIAIESPVVKKEIIGSLENGDYYQENFGIESEMITLAEPGKSFLHGFDANEVQAEALKIGFQECTIHYDWFLGQAVVMHQQSFADADKIDQYLSSLLPYTANMYKYLRFIMKK